MSVAAGAISFLLFLLFQAQGITTGDSGDLVTAAYTFGVPHPPGYPLYTFVGWLLTKLPFFTVAWRVSLLSSIPHAIVVGLAFDIVWRLTKQKTSAVFTGILLAGNYLFFLYGTTPEVFALLDLFVVTLLWLVIRKFWFALFFVFGLALSHHHMIIFLVPAISLVLYKKISFRFLLVFAAGLLPYLYIPFAARGMSIINWDNATTLGNFIRLITRADYGTFQSGSVIGQNPLERFLQLRALGNFLLVDFGPIGLCLIVAGLFGLWKRSKKIFAVIVTALFCLGPLFFFYASYPLANRFTLATFERFLLPLYVLLAIVIGIGHTHIVSFLTHTSLKRAVILVSFVYPMLLCGTTVWRFWGFSTDRTAEHLARDVFVDVPEGSVLALGRDTTLFTTQYVRYGQLYRPDTYLIHGSFLNSPAYQKTIQKIFPNLEYPEVNDSEFLSEFLIANWKIRPIFSNTQYPLPPGWHWIPHGLLFALAPKDSLPLVVDLKKNNDAIWEKMHDPTVGILARYNHLMLSDVRDVYAASRLDYGKVLLRSGEFQSASDQFRAAIALDGDTQLSDAYTHSGLAYLFMNKCEEALEAFTSAKSVSFGVNTDLALFSGITYRDCVGDSVKAADFFSEYETTQKEKEQPLQEW